MNHINRRSKTLSLEQLLALGTTEILKGLVLDRLVIDVRAQVKLCACEHYMLRLCGEEKSGLVNF